MSIELILSLFPVGVSVPWGVIERAKSSDEVLDPNITHSGELFFCFTKVNL